MTNDRRLTKNERRTQAREAAKAQQQKRQRDERLKRGLTIGGILVGAVAIVAIVTLVIVNAIRPPGPGPENMASDGIVVGQGYVAETTPALAADEAPVATDERDDVVQIVIYQDYLCPYCGLFETTNGETIDQLISDGVATVEYHPVSFLDRLSLGEEYSTRAANAAACVAEASPDSFYAWNTLMYENQPGENTEGLTDDELIGLAEQAGVDTNAAFTECVESVQFESWVERATQDAQLEPGPSGEDGVQITGTPTVLVNGEQYRGQPGDGASFTAFVQAALGQVSGGSSTEETPAPSEATPAPSEG
ncbi:DsbA family protein [Agrococcus jejuensis]|uniref:Protein-disulfide isomerase n=1 Tax=Agrococcus jejuensis TaxID=399736 RepID=A0A1G8BA69_9MICO|nr:thioredoxin domain-containing protein [Agrococcus jejuensis]SDH30106.1 Protein-disulfide isomerase [Agrococcus jejuensis]